MWNTNLYCTEQKNTWSSFDCVLSYIILYSSRFTIRSVNFYSAEFCKSITNHILYISDLASIPKAADHIFDNLKGKCTPAHNSVDCEQQYNTLNDIMFMYIH